MHPATNIPSLNPKPETLNPQEEIYRSCSSWLTLNPPPPPKPPIPAPSPSPSLPEPKKSCSKRRNSATAPGPALPSPTSKIGLHRPPSRSTPKTPSTVSAPAQSPAQPSPAPAQPIFSLPSPQPGEAPAQNKLQDQVPKEKLSVKTGAPTPLTLST